MNRRFLLNPLFFLPFSSCFSLDIADILGANPDAARDKAIPAWPFRAIPLNPIQDIIWKDYHSFHYNLFIRNKGSETVMADKIAEIYLGKLTQISESGIKFCGQGSEIIIDELDFNNHPINDPIWQDLFLEEFPEKLSKVTIFTEMDFPNGRFLQSLSDSGKFNVKIFSLKEEPKTDSKMIRA